MVTSKRPAQDPGRSVERGSARPASLDGGDRSSAARPRRILVVEDDPSIVFGVSKNLEFEGYEVLSASDGEAGLKMALDSAVDIIILDIMLPLINGYEICQTIRKHGIKTPVIFLSAKAQETDKVRGLELGGDDYVTKPFGVRELVARVNSIIRRLHDAEKTVLECGPLRLDVEGHNVMRRGKSVELTSKEFKLLKLLLERRGQVLAREDILNHVWGFDYDGTTRTVDNFINRIRQKIGDDLQKPKFILTVRGVGYKFQGER